MGAFLLNEEMGKVSLLQDLTKQMVSAMKSRDKETLATVRMLKAAVQNA